MAKMLCVGGVHDGLRVDREFTARTILIPHITANGEIESKTYTREELAGNGRTFDILLAEGLSPDDLIEMLISKYPEWKGRNNG